jgi:hypothetical protein
MAGMKCSVLIAFLSLPMITANAQQPTPTTATPQCGKQPAAVKIASPKADPSMNSQPATPSTDTMPCQQPTDQPVSPQAANSNQLAKRVFVINNRVDVMVPQHQLKLVEESEIPLDIHAPGLVTVNTYQVQYRFKGGLDPDLVYGSHVTLPILHQADGSSYIKIIPMRLGEVTVDLSGAFPDGGIFHKNVILNVIPSDRKPAKLVVGRLGSPQSPSRMIFMHLGGDRNYRSSLNVNAQYDNVKDLIRIDAAFARFAVRTRSNGPVIRLDESTGVITPANVGEALVETYFGGKTNFTCVVVTQKLDGYYNQSRCKDLLGPGQTLPPLQ